MVFYLRPRGKLGGTVLETTDHLSTDSICINWLPQKIFLVTFLFSAFFACKNSGTESAARQSASDETGSGESFELLFPQATGQFSVGQVERTLYRELDYPLSPELQAFYSQFYKGGESLFEPLEEGAPRPISVSVFYPTLTRSNLNRIPYLSDEFFIGWERQRSTIPVQWRSELKPSVKEFFKKGKAIRNASKMATNLPTVIFSPGGGIPHYFYRAIIDELVSHGYTVVGVSYPFLSGAVHYEKDGNDEYLLMNPMATLEIPFEEASKDLEFVFDQINSGELGSHLGSGPVFAVGHSIGGALSNDFCVRMQEKCLGAINYDGGHVAMESEWSKRGTWPMADNGSGQDYTAVNYARFRPRSHGVNEIVPIPLQARGLNQFVIDIDGIAHRTFVDDLYFGMVNEPGNTLDPSQAFRIITSHTLVFLNATNGSQPAVEGSRAFFPVTIQQKYGNGQQYGDKSRRTKREIDMAIAAHKGLITQLERYREEPPSTYEGPPAP
jgi:pimeloyl-ACP methyl ester carboxylesterase